MLTRYSNDPRIALGYQLGTANLVIKIRSGMKNGTIPVLREVIATSDDRLDTLAGAIYGDGRLWWVLAAASDIGWGLQVPPGTVIKVIKMDDIGKVI